MKTRAAVAWAAGQPLTIEEVDLENRKMKVERMMEAGYDVIELPMPALITVVKEINEPRVPSIRGKMRAKKYEPQVWGPDEIKADPKQLGLDASPTRVTHIFTPDMRRRGEILEGDSTEEKVDSLYKKLKDTGVMV